MRISRTRQRARRPHAAACSCRRHLGGKHLPRWLHRDVRRLLYLLRLLALVLDLLDAGAPIEDSICEWVLEARQGGGRHPQLMDGNRGSCKENVVVP